MVFTKTFYYLSVLLVLATIGLPACGSGSSGTSTPSPQPQTGPPNPESNPPQPNLPDPDTIPTGASRETTLNDQQPDASLEGIVKVTFSQNDAARAPSITLTKQKDPNSAQALENVQTELEVEVGSDYEIAIKTSILPTEKVLVGVSVPDVLAAMVRDDTALAIYYEISGDEDQPSGYVPVESVYDPTTKTVSAEMPSWALQDVDNGTLQAIFKIAVAKAYSDTSTSSPLNPAKPNRHEKMIAPPGGDLFESLVLPNVLCPLKPPGCTEISRFAGTRTVEGTTRSHLGTDLRAQFIDVYAAMSGSVLRVFLKGDQNEAGIHVTVKDPISQTITKYMHLSQVKVSQGNQVIAGATRIGVSGKSSSIDIDPHLHFEVLRPVTKTCKGDRNHAEGLLSGCKAQYVQNYLDPFSLLLKKVKIERRSPPGSMPVDVQTGQTLKLALMGSDSENTLVTSEIKADPGNEDRRVIWPPSNPSFTITPGDTPETFNQADLRFEKDVATIIYASWDGINSTPIARYELAKEAIPIVESAGCIWTKFDETEFISGATSAHWGAHVQVKGTYQNEMIMAFITRPPDQTTVPDRSAFNSGRILDQPTDSIPYGTKCTEAGRLFEYGPNRGYMICRNPNWPVSGLETFDIDTSVIGTVHDVTWYGLSVWIPGSGIQTSDMRAYHSNAYPNPPQFKLFVLIDGVDTVGQRYEVFRQEVPCLPQPT